MKVALTGTPGVGKTTVAALAAADGWRVVDVKAWAKEVGAVVGFDAADDANVLDMEALWDRAREMQGERLLFEGHVAQDLPVDAILVIRVDPDALRPRLEARGYSRSKVLENLEAEALDIILQEALDSEATVIQRDGTRRSPEQLWQSFADCLSGGLKTNDLEHVDWSDRLPL